MPTVVKTWAFASDAEGLADAGVSAVVFAHLSSDGNPSGCVRFTQATKAVTHTERAVRASAGETWETWGVPAGATVTDVQVTAWQERLVANTKLSSHSISARVVGSGGSSVHSAGDLLAGVALGTTTDASWQAGAAGTQRAVDTGAQASTTDVRLELEYSVTTSGGGGSASVDQRFDQIALTITYSESVPPVELGAAMSGSGSSSGSVQVARRLSGAATGAGTASGAVTVGRLLSAAMSGSGQLAGDIQVGGGAVELAAAMSASGAMGAMLVVERRLLGIASGSSQTGGAIVTGRRLSASMTGAGTSSGSITGGTEGGGGHGPECTMMRPLHRTMFRALTVPMLGRRR